MDIEMPVCLFGQTDYNFGSTANYVALKVPIVSEGCVLRTYQVHPGTDTPMDLPGSTLLPPKVNIDEAGHVLLSK